MSIQQYILLCDIYEYEEEIVVYCTNVNVSLAWSMVIARYWLFVFISWLSIANGIKIRVDVALKFRSKFAKIVNHNRSCGYMRLQILRSHSTSGLQPAHRSIYLAANIQQAKIDKLTNALIYIEFDGH